MRRRHFLRAAGASATLVVGAGPAGARGDRSVGAASTGDLAPLGTLDVRNVAEGVVGQDGETVFLAAGDGFVVVDVADPAKPTVLADRRGLAAGAEEKPVEGVKDVSVSGDRLLVAGPDYGTDDRTFSGFQVFDVSDRAAPVRVAAVDTDHAIHNAFLDGETAYLTGTGLADSPLVAWDLSGDDPERLGDWSVLDARPDWGDVQRSIRACHDVHVQDGVAAVAFWDAGTWLLDVSDPATPRPLFALGGRDPGDVPSDASTFAEVFELPGNSHYARQNEDGTLLAVGREANDRPKTDRTGGPGGITLWNLDRDVPEVTATLAPPAIESEERTNTAHNFAFRGDRLYTAWYSGGVRVYDVADPANPLLVDAWKDEAHASFWTAVPTATGFVGVSAVDVSVPKAERRETGEGDRLYTFPEPDGEPSPAETTEEDRTASVVTSSASGTGTTTSGGTATTTSASTATTMTSEAGVETTTRPNDDATTSDGTTTTDGQPGFGILAAVGAGALGVWRRARRE